MAFLVLPECVQSLSNMILEIPLIYIYIYIKQNTRKDENMSNQRIDILFTHNQTFVVLIDKITDKASSFQIYQNILSFKDTCQ